MIRVKKNRRATTRVPAKHYRHSEQQAMAPVAVAVTLDTPSVPPYWALLERELLNGISDGCVEFFEQ
jgi:hypothetical protein